MTTNPTTHDVAVQFLISMLLSSKVAVALMSAVTPAQAEDVVKLMCSPEFASAPQASRDACAVQWTRQADAHNRAQAVADLARINARKAARASRVRATPRVALVMR